MPIPTFTKMGPYPDFDAVVAKINTLVSELQNLMLSLDDANFRSITAAVMDVGELSAITANMGKLTSGEIYGAYIATKEGEYPRAEMSSSDNLIKAASSDGQWIAVYPINGSTGTPQLTFRDETISPLASAFMYIQPNSWSGGVASHTWASTKFIRITPGGTSPFTSQQWLLIDGDVTLFDFSNIYSIGDAQTLQQALNGKANAFSGYTGNVPIVTGINFAGETATFALLHFTNGILTSVT